MKGHDRTVLSNIPWLTLLTTDCEHWCEEYLLLGCETLAVQKDIAPPSSGMALIGRIIFLWMRTMTTVAKAIILGFVFSPVLADPSSLTTLRTDSPDIGLIEKSSSLTPSNCVRIPLLGDLRFGEIKRHCQSPLHRYYHYTPRLHRSQV